MCIFLGIYCRSHNITLLKTIVQNGPPIINPSHQTSQGQLLAKPSARHHGGQCKKLITKNHNLLIENYYINFILSTKLIIPLVNTAAATTTRVVHFMAGCRYLLSLCKRKLISWNQMLSWVVLHGIILGKNSGNEKRRYVITAFLIGWPHTQNEFWCIWTLVCVSSRYVSRAWIKGGIPQCLWNVIIIIHDLL